MNLYYTTRTYTPTATSAATGYPVTNLLLRQVRRPWRSGAVQNTTQTLKLNLGASRTPTVIYLHDVYAPCSTINLAHSLNDSDYTSLPNLTLVTLPSGRQAALSAVGVACQYLRLVFNGLVSVPGDNWVQIGRAVVLEAQATLMGVFPGDITIHYPQLHQELLNGAHDIADIGAESHEIAFTGDYLASELVAVDALRQEAVLDVCGWPFLVRSLAATEQLTRANALISRIPYTLTEIV